VLARLLEANAFYILPRSELRALNPSHLPREIFISDASTTEPSTTVDASGTVPEPSTQSKRKGRPTKREKLRKAKEAASGLEKWLDKTEFHCDPEDCVVDEPLEQRITPDPRGNTTHVLISNGPNSTREGYRLRKRTLLDVLEHPSAGDDAGPTMLKHANESILDRLQRISEMATERNDLMAETPGRDGLDRVGRVVAEFVADEETGVQRPRGGLLSLLEGAGRVEHSHI
jgi:hypothetical protein